MSARKPEPLFYLTIKEVKSRPKYKTKSLTVYRNGVPTTIDRFAKWLEKAIEEKVGE